jgi:signal transduction histidine kinase/CheY-like chemotaxis protein
MSCEGNVLVKVMYQDDVQDAVETSILDDLIAANRIKRLLRSDGWATVGIDPIRVSRGDYPGPERRQRSASPDISRQRAGDSGQSWSLSSHEKDFMTSQGGLLLLDKKTGTIIEADQTTADLLGYSKEEFPGKSFEDVGLTNIIDLQETINQLGQVGFIDYGDLPAVNKEGRRIDLDIHLILRDKIIQCYVRDITPCRMAEDALRQSELRCRLLFETMLQGVIYQDRGGNILLMNPAAEHILGKTSAECIGRSLNDEEHLALREDGSPFPAGEHPSMIAMQTGRKVRDMAMGIYNPLEEGYRWINVSAVPLFKHGEENPYQVYILFDDITERKRIEDALRESELRLRNSEATLRLATESTGLGTFDFDPLTRKFVWSGLTKLHFGLPPDANVDYNIFLSGLHPDDRHRVDAIMQNALLKPLDKGKCIIRYRTFGLVDGKERWISARGRVFFDGDGRAIRLIGTTLDISEQVKLEQEVLKLQKLESLGVLAGGIAHDFNNLLTAILGNISLAKLVSPDKLHERLTQAERAALRAKDLTNRLLIFSRGGTPVKKAIPIADLIENAIALSCAGRRAVCEVISSGNLWPADVDEGLMGQAINNIIMNADEAMPHGGRITINIENAEISEGDALPLKSGKYIKITIKDQGVGIPEENLGRIFDPYFTTKEQGRGLGLASVYSIIKSHGGCITVQSLIGSGTAFAIYLPAAASLMPVPSDKEIRPAAGKGKVLIMDDEEVIRHVAGEMLKYIGYEVELAKDGSEALDIYTKALLAANPFDAVIMDLTIPGGMGGKETIKKLLEIDPNVRAIVSSGYSNDPVLSNFKDYGFVGVIKKPYRFDELIEQLDGIDKAG